MLLSVVGLVTPCLMAMNQSTNDQLSQQHSTTIQTDKQATNQTNNRQQQV